MYKLFLQFCMCIRIDIDWQGLSYRKSHIPHTCTQWSVCFIHSRNWSYWLPPTLIHKLSLPDKPHIIPFCTAITPGINAIISVMSIKVPRILVKLCFYTSLLLFLHDSPHMGFILKFIFSTGRSSSYSDTVTLLICPHFFAFATEIPEARRPGFAKLHWMIHIAFTLDLLIIMRPIPAGQSLFPHPTQSRQPWLRSQQ